ncbi:MAG: hypothetical protein ACN6NW_11575 [Acinetobacter amyesii]
MICALLGQGTDSTTLSPTLPQQDKDSDSSTTYATLTASNTTLAAKTRQ